MLSILASISLQHANSRPTYPLCPSLSPMLQQKPPSSRLVLRVSTVISVVFGWITQLKPVFYSTTYAAMWVEGSSKKHPAFTARSFGTQLVQEKTTSSDACRCRAQIPHDTSGQRARFTNYMHLCIYIYIYTTLCVWIYLDISGSFFLVSVPPVSSPGVCLELESLESTIPPSISMAGPSSSSSSKPKASRVSRYDLTWHAQPWRTMVALWSLCHRMALLVELPPRWYMLALSYSSLWSYVNGHD